MSTFQLIIQDMSQISQHEAIESFIATDMSGRFGIQAGHETLVTVLRPGLARFREDNQNWHYIAQAGATLLFEANTLTLSTTQFVISDDRDSLLKQMDAEWKALAEDLGSTKRNIVQVEQALARKLLEMNRQGESL